jgi:VCBS repeat-containing protein
MSGPAVAALTLEIHVTYSQSLKDKRQVVKSLKDRLRQKFNIAVAEIDGLESWQRSVVAAVTVSNDRAHVAQVLQAVESEAAAVLGSMLVSAEVEWL